jgi:plasmid stabilization system protein ParE
MGWKIIIAPSAQSDLEDIVRYIAQHNPEAAIRMGYELISRADSLTPFPEIGRSVPEVRNPDLREIICRSYRIIYRLKRDKQYIQIVRFWHGARGFPHIPAKF